MTTLFIGVVSYASSQFAASQGPNGLAQQLNDLLSVAQMRVKVQVNTTNLYDSKLHPVSQLMVQASLTEQLHLERKWGRYLGGRQTLIGMARGALRWMRRIQRRVCAPDPHMIERLLNIEMSHFSLLEAGIASDSSWILILEDDAAAPNIADCAAGLVGIIKSEAHQPSFINISRSFTSSELGVEHLLSRVEEESWAGSVPRVFYSASRPVTNTVCAILYNTEFARKLLDEMKALPVQPVVPIDWKINLALMQMFDKSILKAGDCWIVDPAPIDQLSMHSLQ